MKSNIGITGSTGSLGRILIKYKKKINYFYFKGDIRKKKEVFEWFKKNRLDVVIHLAAIVPIKEVNKNKKKALQTNYLGTKNIVDASLANNISWLFFSSTSHVYKSSKIRIKENSRKEPISYYGKTKLLAEKYIQKKMNKKINYCIGRIFSTANKNQRKNYLVPDLKIKTKTKSKIIKLENLNHYRDFILMKDISKIVHFLRKKKYNGIINIGNGKPILLKNIAKIIFKKKNKIPVFIDNFKPTFLVSNNSKLKKLINFKLENNLRKMIY